MTSSRMSRLYVEEARGRVTLVGVALEKGLWAATIREAQECVELFLKGALRLVAVEPARTHDVAEVLRRERDRFPEWFRSAIDHLAAVSTEMAGDRGPRSMAISARSSARRSCSTKRTRVVRSRTRRSSPSSASASCPS